jgi:hypothetical protein
MLQKSTNAKHWVTVLVMGHHGASVLTILVAILVLVLLV